MTLWRNIYKGMAVFLWLRSAVVNYFFKWILKTMLTDKIWYANKKYSFLKLCVSRKDRRRALQRFFAQIAWHLFSGGDGCWWILIHSGFGLGGLVTDNKKKQKVGWRKTRDNQKNNQIKEGVVWLHAIILTSYGPHNYKEVVFESFENISPPLVHRCDEGFRDRNSSQRFDLSSLMAGLNISVPSSPL